MISLIFELRRTQIRLKPYFLGGFKTFLDTKCESISKESEQK